VSSSDGSSGPGVHGSHCTVNGIAVKAKSLIFINPTASFFSQIYAQKMITILLSNLISIIFNCFNLLDNSA
jgi:hypothetical protein